MTPEEREDELTTGMYTLEVCLEIPKDTNLKALQHAMQLRLVNVCRKGIRYLGTGPLVPTNKKGT